MNVHLEMPEYATGALCARLGYAFRLFCAIYGHRPVFNADSTVNWDVAIRYRDASASASISDARTVWLCRGLLDRDLRKPAPPPIKYARDGLITLLHYAPRYSRAPDWIGEIFEWISCADEYSVTRRDSAGEPLFEATYAGRHNLDICIPYAALAMRGLQLEICRVTPRLSQHAAAPEGLEGNAVIPTHNVDCFPSGRWRAASRLLQIVMGSKKESTHQVISQTVNIAERELALGFNSSFYFLTQRTQHLDPGNAHAEPAVLEAMRWLKARGMDVGVRSSYSRLNTPDEPDDEPERERGGHAENGRRLFDVHQLHLTLDRLLPEVELAGLQQDSSIGWSRHIGFRAGACFAYPPYNFANESPAAFLEFPLIATDEALRSPRGHAGVFFHEVSQMIAASRRLGWGGISLLWRPAAFASGPPPQEIGTLYWRLAEDRYRWNDAWLKASRFLDLARGRYIAAGLLAANTSLTEQQYAFAAFAGSRASASAQTTAVTDEALSA